MARMGQRLMASSQVIPAVAGEQLLLQDIVYTIADKCDINEGRWVCVTHSEAFQNQMAKDSHIDEGTHVLAWMCSQHGPEVP